MPPSPRTWPRRLRALLLVGFVGALTLLPLPSAEGDAHGVREGRLVRLPRLHELARVLTPVREPYPLDAIERFVDPRARLNCPTQDIVPYRGAALRYERNAHVNRAFLPRLEKLEGLINEVATELYGRAPRRLLHRGAYNCRATRGRPERMSEHALGNALDVRGFRFGPLPRGASLPEGAPSHLRRAFRVEVDRHWAPRRERDATHARFLHTLMDRLRERPDITRGVVGPPTPRHHDHLHLDVAPWRYARYRYEPTEPLSRR